MAEAAAVAQAEHIREVTREVLSRREFAPDRSFEAVIQELVSYVLKLLGGIGDWSSANPGLAWLVILGLVLLLGVLVAHLVYVVVSNLNPPDALGAPRAGPAAGEILPAAFGDWRQALARARAELAQGRQRDALWIGHRVLLAFLDRRGDIAFAAAKTNSQYLSECPPAASSFGLLGELTELYDRVVYGHRSCAPDQVAMLLDRLEGAVQEHAA